MNAEKGRFFWYDLITTDLAAARAFYTEVLGWTLTSFGPDYTMWTAGDQPVGGIGPLPEDAQKAGTPPHWLAHIETDDVDATAKKAEGLGGRVLLPGTDIPSVGRFAILADPQGAVFSVFKPGPENRMQSGDRDKLGHFSWSELNTTDYKSAWKFYEGLFGWKPTMEMDMGPGLGNYFMFGMSPDKSIGGMSDAANMMKAPAHWMYYVNVANIEATLAKVKDKGGQVLNGPMDIPGGDRIAQCMDPQGAMFAIYESGPRK